jgi:hypothetical protein
MSRYCDRYCCELCENECDIQEASLGLGYSSEETCEVFVCMNKNCENYDKTLLDVSEYYSEREVEYG